MIFHIPETDALQLIAALRASVTVTVPDEPEVVKFARDFVAEKWVTELSQGLLHAAQLQEKARWGVTNPKSVRRNCIPLPPEEEKK